MRSGRSVWIVGVVIVVAGGGLWAGRRAEPKASVGRVYTARGFGGYAPAPPHRATPLPPDPLRDLLSAYNAGEYAQAESAALQIVALKRNAPSAPERRQAALVQSIAAYTAARQQRFALARERFATLRDLAETLPDQGALAPSPGEVQPTLEEEGAFQHGVCTAALGDTSGAEAEYRYFLKRYPQSALVQAALKRIARLHGGNVPQDAEALWRQAMQAQQQKERARQRERSLCGPECLAEALRRQGKRAEVHQLAEEMQTGEAGTSLLALSKAAKKRGLAGAGVALTEAGLRQQRLPLIALLRTDHYVLVERLTPEQVVVWDPDGQGAGKQASAPTPGRSGSRFGTAWP